MQAKRTVVTSVTLTNPQKNRGRVLLYAVIGVAVIALGATAIWASTCPCERTPGIYLSGEEVTEPVVDWTFANDVQLCQIRTRSGILPHAINLNCMADTSGNLFLSCSQCEGKRWSTAALQNPNAQIRLNERVYPVSLRRLSASEELDNAWLSRALKLGSLRGNTPSEIPERPDHWWSFQVTSGG